MTQQQVNVLVSNILAKHVGRKKAIFFNQLFLQCSGATKGQVREAIRQLRLRRRPISSRPRVGYYLDRMEMSGLKNWVQHWRIAKNITPTTPASLAWV
ncbi:hypothetical protein [Anaerosporobacter sp.]|uniref:hypothetical protein n=1 Tax=Anaerosporobacter sp. TaxID=1872529 RepID=UPI00286F6092|nr:hypothetical protein [Anaerosporobacter sp.]